jgi:predicted DCC family thiol-disulfide oxidoreductase YuxK
MQHQTSSDLAGAAEVFYDGACPVCRREIAVLKRAVGSAPIQWRDVAEGTAEAAPDLSREDALARFHVRRADGQLISGAVAFFAVWRHVPWLRPLAVVLEWPPLAWCAERAYRGFLVVRRLWR